MRTPHPTRKTVHRAAALALFLHAAVLAAPETTPPRPSPRYKALAKVIDRNVGYAHMTRGVNFCTLLALRDQVTEKDIEVLAQLLGSEDLVYRLASANVLSVMGPAAISTLQARGGDLGPSDVAEVIADADKTQQIIERYRQDRSCEGRPAASAPRR